MNFKNYEEGCPMCRKRFCEGCLNPNEKMDTDAQKQYLSKKKGRKEVMEAILSLMDALNHNDDDLVFNAVADAIASSHRTLQQSFMNVVIRASINYFALADNNISLSDARNDAAAKLGTKLQEVMNDSYLPLI